MDVLSAIQEDESEIGHSQDKPGSLHPMEHQEMRDNKARHVRPAPSKGKYKPVTARLTR
jgi:hypothetical protein